MSRKTAYIDFPFSISEKLSDLFAEQKKAKEKDNGERGIMAQVYPDGMVVTALTLDESIAIQKLLCGDPNNSCRTLSERIMSKNPHIKQQEG